MSDKGYWRRRAAEYAAEWENRCKDELEAELKKYFRSSLGEIEQEIESLYSRLVIPGQQNLFPSEEAKRLIRGAEYKKWRKSLAEYLALSHTDSKILKELNVLAMRSRINRLEKLYSETLMSLQKLGEKYEGAVQEFLEAAYKERYYRGIYDLAKVGKLAIPVAKVEPAKLEKVLASKWQGGNYSSRIWKNTEKLSAEIKKAVAQGVHRGLSVQKLSKNLAREMGSSYKNAERLVRTELNFAQNQAARESLEAAGLKEYEFLATLDHRTTPRCQALDGTIHLLEEYMPGSNAPPMHPRCRSTICAVTEGGTRVAKSGGKNVKIPADWDYKKWRGETERLITGNNAAKAEAPKWAIRNSANILTKNEYAALKESAEKRGIFFIGVKQFDGTAETVAELVETLGGLLNQFPKVTDRRHKLELELSAKLDAEDFAITKNRTITLNANAYRDVKLLQEEYQKAVAEGWFVKGTDYRAIIHHEFGHVVSNVYKINALEIACEITGLSEIETLKIAKETLSEYAGSVRNGGEIIAEVFADMSTDNPSEFSRKFYAKVLEAVQNV